METNRKRLEKASEGKPLERGGLNMQEIKDYLKSLPNADEKQINAAKRPELNKLLIAALKKPEVKAATLVDVKTNPMLPLVAEKPEVKAATLVDVKTNPILPLFTEIADVLRKNTIIQSDLNSVILKYFKPSIKVEYMNGKISYLTQPEITEDDNEPQFREYLWTYDYETRSFIMDLDICGILELTDPAAMFEKSQIRKINGHVILIGSTMRDFHLHK